MATPDPATATPATAAPKMIRLLRDGLVWQYGAPWPSPHSHPQLPFHVTDIFFDRREDAFAIFGSPRKGSDEEKRELCLFALVPFDLGSAIVESLIPRDNAILQVNLYVADSVTDWAHRWDDDDDDDDDDDPAPPPPAKPRVIS